MTREGIILDAEGRDSGERFWFCASCGERLAGLFIPAAGLRLVASGAIS